MVTNVKLIVQAAQLMLIISLMIDTIFKLLLLLLRMRYILHNGYGLIELTLHIVIITLVCMCFWVLVNNFHRYPLYINTF